VVDDIVSVMVMTKLLIIDNAIDAFNVADVGLWMLL
jgi:hypothetical protein